MLPTKEAWMLIGFTVVWLCVYVPLETYASIVGAGVFTFGYLIDVVGMLLMVAGIRDARRAPSSWSTLAAGWAWTSANFWRGTMQRYWAIEQGGTLQFGSGELVVGPILTGLAIAALIATLSRARG
jgi:hypothetical protein